MNRLIKNPSINLNCLDNEKFREAIPFRISNKSNDAEYTHRLRCDKSESLALYVETQRERARCEADALSGNRYSSWCSGGGAEDCKPVARAIYARVRAHTRVRGNE